MRDDEEDYPRERASYRAEPMKEPRESLIVRVDELEKRVASLMKGFESLSDEFSAFREKAARELGL